MNLQSKPRFSVWFAAVVISATIGVSGYLSMRGLLEANRRVTHTHVVLEKLGHFLTVLTDAETGQRGYVLTGEPRYLEPYIHARSLSHQDMDVLRELTLDNRAQQESLVQLQALSEAKLARLQKTIELRDKSGLDAAISAIHTGEGKRIMDNLRSVIATMQGREQLLLQTRTNDAKASATRFMVAIAVWLPLLSILAILMTRRSKGAQLIPVMGARLHTRRANLLRYAFAIFVVAVAGVLRGWWGREVGQLPPFVTFFPAVLIVASIVGSGPGLLATALSTLAAAFFFLEPLNSFAISSPNDLLTTAIFTGTNFFTCVLADRLQRSRSAEVVTRQAEESLRDHSLLLETVVNHLPAAISLIRGSDMKLQFVNPVYQAIAPDAVMVGKTLDELWPDTGQQFGDICHRVLATGDPHHAVNELNMIRRSPESPPEAGYFTWSMFRVRLPRDEGWGLLLTALETTASKLAEVALQESELRFRTMVDAIPQLACIARADGYIYWFNQRWYEYTGATPHDMEGWGWQSVHDTETLPAVLEAWKASIATGEPFEMVFPLRGADGRFRSFLTRVQPLKDSHGRVVQWFGTNTDVEELKRADEARARLAAIVESSDDAILSKQLDGTILTWNAAAERLFGYRSEDIIGCSISQLVPPERSEEEADIISRLRRGEQCEHIETIRMAKDGRKLDVSVTISPLKNRDGNIIGASKIARDISGRKRAEETLAAAMQAANVANQAKSDFLANMSHEMRTPMNAILGFAETLVRKEQSKTERIECAQVILHNSSHLLELINRILDLSKIEAGQMTIDRTACDLPELLLGLISQIRPKAAETHVGFEVTFAGPIPRVVQTDSMRLRQILLNLLGNAVKFTKSGKIELKVSDTGSGGPNIALRMDVIDSGIGITPEQLERLFRPFTQADTSNTREFGGTGLGLTISRQFAKLLSGDVTVTSTVGVGSIFTLMIDGGRSAGVERLQGLTEATLPTKLNEAVPTVIRISGRILIVDDGVANQRLLRMQLGDAGAEVVSAENGQIAVDLATAQPFDLILMDMQMPVMDGYAATTELRRRGLTTPIVALTASAMATDRENCMSAGCSDYLSKPINEENLLRAVKRHLRDLLLAPAIA